LLLYEFNRVTVRSCYAVKQRM